MFWNLIYFRWGCLTSVIVRNLLTNVHSGFAKVNLVIALSYCVYASGLRSMTVVFILFKQLLFLGRLYLLFQGALIHQELYYLLKDEKDVHLSLGSAQGNGIIKGGQVMSSKFCPNIYGDNPSSNRLFDAIVSHGISVIISDNRTSFRGHSWLFQILYLYTCIRCCQEGLFTESTWGNQTWRLKQSAERIKRTHHFECQYQSQEGDAMHMIWKAGSCKISSVRIRLHRENIFHQFQFTQNRDYGEALEQKWHDFNL